MDIICIVAGAIMMVNGKNNNQLVKRKWGGVLLTIGILWFGISFMHGYDVAQQQQAYPPATPAPISCTTSNLDIQSYTTCN